MRFAYIILGLILAIIGYVASVFTWVGVDWQTTPLPGVNVPVPVLYQPFGFVAFPLYVLAAICILYGCFARGSQP